MSYDAWLEQPYEDAAKREKETPYDDEMGDAFHMRGKITILLGHIRDSLHDYHKKYGEIDALADTLMAAEDGFAADCEKLIERIENKINAYDPNDYD